MTDWENYICTVNVASQIRILDIQQAAWLTLSYLADLITGFLSHILGKWLFKVPTSFQNPKITVLWAELCLPKIYMLKP